MFVGLLGNQQAQAFYIHKQSMAKSFIEKFSKIDFR